MICSVYTMKMTAGMTYDRVCTYFYLHCAVRHAMKEHILKMRYSYIFHTGMGVQCANHYA